MKNTIKPLTLIFIGIQGSGKGTQAEILSEKLGFVFLDTGSRVRSFVKSGKLPKEDKILTLQGKLIRNETTNRIVLGALSRIPSNKEVIIDGYPRSIGQAKALVSMLKKTGRIDNYYAVEFKISKKTAYERVLTRLICTKCGKIMGAGDKKCPCGGKLERRRDDNAEVLANRLKFVSKNLDAIKAYFRDKKRLVTVNGDQPRTRVTAEFIKKVKP